MAFYGNTPLPDTNARQPAVTIRPSSTALLTIDSEDRYSNYFEARDNPTSPYDFKITKPENIMAGFFTRLAVTEITFPWVIPNINLKTYQINVSYDVSGAFTAFRTLLITPGFYSPTMIAAEMQRKIRNFDPALANFTMKYGSTSVGFPGPTPNFSYNTNNPTTVTQIAFNPMDYNSFDYPYPPTTKQLFDILGFTTTRNETLATGAAGLPTLCQAIRYVDIVCNQLTSVSALKDQTSQTIVRDMLCRLYLGDTIGFGISTAGSDASGNYTSSFVPPGCAPMVIYRSFPFPKQIQWIPNQNIPGYLSFQVYDDTGALLTETTQVPGGPGGRDSIDWSMTIQVTEC
jgi:hypothetical protein